MYQVLMPLLRLVVVGVTQRMLILISLSQLVTNPMLMVKQLSLWGVKLKQMVKKQLLLLVTKQKQHPKIVQLLVLVLSQVVNMQLLWVSKLRLLQTMRQLLVLVQEAMLKILKLLAAKLKHQLVHFVLSPLVRYQNLLRTMQHL